MPKLTFGYGRKTLWHQDDRLKLSVWMQFWGVSIGDWHIGIQRWRTTHDPR